jgi:hypothetical protein
VSTPRILGFVLALLFIGLGLLGIATGKVLTKNTAKIGLSFFERRRSPGFFWFTVYFDFAIGIVFIWIALSH